jgi:hypothetical protein
VVHYAYSTTRGFAAAITAIFSFLLVVGFGRRQFVVKPFLCVAHRGVLGAVPPLGLLPATLHQAVGLVNRFEGALGIPLFGVTTLFVLPQLLLLLPHYELLTGRAGRKRWWLTRAAAALAVGLGGWAVATAGFDADKPRPDHISYVYDADADRAMWGSYDRHLDEWTATFFGEDAARGPYETAAWGTFEAFTAPAPRVELTPPRFEAAPVHTGDAVRGLDGRIVVPTSAREVRVHVQAPSSIRTASLDGRTMDLSSYKPASDGTLALNYVAPPADGFRLSLRLGEPTDERIRVEVERYWSRKSSAAGVKPSRSVGMCSPPCSAHSATRLSSLQPLHSRFQVSSPNTLRSKSERPASVGSASQVFRSAQRSATVRAPG